MRPLERAAAAAVAAAVGIAAACGAAESHVAAACGAAESHDAAAAASGKGVSLPPTAALLLTGDYAAHYDESQTSERYDALNPAPFCY